jgi:hypothetical protein
VIVLLHSMCGTHIGILRIEIENIKPIYRYFPYTHLVTLSLLLRKASTFESIISTTINDQIRYVHTSIERDKNSDVPHEPWKH